MKPLHYALPSQASINARVSSRFNSLLRKNKNSDSDGDSDGDSSVQCIKRKAPATCGELIQGAINGHDFLVNCPIDRFSYAEAKSTSNVGLQIDGASRFEKIRQAVSRLNLQDRISGFKLSVNSDVPRGKGMASSSADITAALAAIMDNAGISRSLEELTQLVVSVEPSDCVHLPGISQVGHLDGKLYSSYQAPQNLGVIVVDCGGEIDTVEFDREHAREVYDSQSHTIVAALSLLITGLREGNLNKIAIAATESAQLSQQILPKPHFNNVLRFAKNHDLLGVNCAHSGTVLGLLYEIVPGAKERIMTKLEKRFGSALPVIGTHHVISGGTHAY